MNHERVGHLVNPNHLPEPESLYDHEPVPVCGDCGDPLETRHAEEEFMHLRDSEAYDAYLDSLIPVRPEPEPEEVVTWSMVEERLREGKAVIISGQYYEGLGALSDAERAFLECIFPSEADDAG